MMKLGGIVTVRSARKVSALFGWKWDEDAGRLRYAPWNKVTWR